MARWEMGKGNSYVGDHKLGLVIDSFNCRFALRHEMIILDVIAEKKFLCNYDTSSQVRWSISGKWIDDHWRKLENWDSNQ